MANCSYSGATNKKATVFYKRASLPWGEDKNLLVHGHLHCMAPYAPVLMVKSLPASRGHGTILHYYVGTTIVTIGIIGYTLGLYWANGKENGNYYTWAFERAKSQG